MNVIPAQNSLALFLAAVIVLVASGTIHADPEGPPGAPPWYGDDEETPWEGLDVEGQKDVYIDFIGDCGTTLKTLRRMYKANKKAYEKTADDLDELIEDIGAKNGVNPPGPVPRPPADGEGAAGQAAWQAYIDAMNTWLQTYNTWYAQLSAEEKAQVGGKLGELSDITKIMSNLLRTISETKAARGGAENSLANHCAYHDQQ